MAEEKKYFWDGLLRETPNGPVLVGHKCKGCGKVYFPATTLCNQCLSEEFEDVDLPRCGMLYSHTTTCVPLGRFPIPHAIGHILFQEQKVRVFSPLVAGEDVRYGDEMELTEDVLWTEEDGTQVWGYRFKKVEG